MLKTFIEKRKEINTNNDEKTKTNKLTKKI